MSERKPTADGMLEFFDFAAEKGLMAKGTAVARKVAAKNVLSVLDADERKDLSTIDTDEVFNRFMHIRGGEFKPDSLQVYRGRFENGLSEYTAWLNNPAEFKPKAPRKLKLKTRKFSPSKQASSGGEAASRKDEQSQSGEYSEDVAPLIFPISIRGKSVVLRLSGIPSDLKKSEADRISSLISSLSSVLAAMASEEEEVEKE